MTATVEELAPRTEDEVRAHLAAGKLVEGLQHMSPEYLKGIRRILTVSADTEPENGTWSPQGDQSSRTRSVSAALATPGIIAVAVSAALKTNALARMGGSVGE